MDNLLDFLRTHEEAFRSRNRLASLYSDFRYQRQTNPDGYQANATAWLRALSAAAKAGVLPSQTGTEHDHLVLHSGEELLSALQTQENGRPLALGSVLDNGVEKKDLILLKDFLDAQQTVYHKSWLPTPLQVLKWGLKQIGVIGGEAAEDKLVKGNFVIMANVETASKAVIELASKTATSNTSRIFSKDLFASHFCSAVGVDTFSPNDLSVLLTHLSRDRSAISYSPATGTVKFKTAAETQPAPITEEDNNVASLRSLIASLEPQIQQLTDKIAKLDVTAREAVAKKQLTTAKSALRSKKLADSTLQRRTETLTQLEEVYVKIEQAADQVEMVRVMEASSQTLRNLNKQTGGVERVQDVMDGLKEEMMNADEISQAINETSAGAIDEVEVEDELEAMEKAEREKQEALERVEREKREAAEAEETKRKLAELEDTASLKDPVKESDTPLIREQRAAE